MPKKHKDLTDYKNFWLIWLSCAGHPKGASLFNIQKNWKIETNYLYHKESGLGKPLVKSMIEDGYLSKEGKRIRAEFGWITDYMIKRHKLGVNDGWTPDIFVIEKWTSVQKFMEKNCEVFFADDIIRDLYENNIDSIKEDGCHIFDDILLFVFVSSIAPLCERYHAENVIRVAYTVIGIGVRRKVLGYFGKLKDRLKNVKGIPALVENEEEFLKVLSPAF